MTDTQDAPIEDGHDDANFSEKLAGIVNQVKADIQLGHEGDARTLLEQRLADAGFELTDAEIDSVHAEIESATS